MVALPCAVSPHRTRPRHSRAWTRTGRREQPATSRIKAVISSVRTIGARSMTVVCASQQVKSTDPGSVDVGLVLHFGVALVWRSPVKGGS